jgi:hypothetical protein
VQKKQELKATPISNQRVEKITLDKTTLYYIIGRGVAEKRGIMQR